MGEYDMAIPFLKKAISINPDSSMALLALAICYAGVGKGEEANSCITRVLEINPTMTIGKYITGMPKKDKVLLKDFAELLHKAGLPD